MDVSHQNQPCDLKIVHSSEEFTNNLFGAKVCLNHSIKKKLKNEKKKNKNTTSFKKKSRVMPQKTMLTQGPFINCSGVI